jgi:hypothetical protein
MNGRPTPLPDATPCGHVRRDNAPCNPGRCLGDYTATTRALRIALSPLHHYRAPLRRHHVGLEARGDAHLSVVAEADGVIGALASVSSYWSRPGDDGVGEFWVDVARTHRGSGFGRIAPQVPSKACKARSFWKVRVARLPRERGKSNNVSSHQLPRGGDAPPQGTGFIGSGATV